MGRIVLSAQGALFQYHVCPEVDASLTAVVQYAGLLGRAVKQTVMVLYGRHVNTLGREDFFRTLELGQIMIGYAYTTDFSFFNQQGKERSPAFHISRIMNPVDIDIIRSEAFKASFQHLRNRVSGLIVGNLRCEFSGNEYLITRVFTGKGRKQGL